MSVYVDDNAITGKSETELKKELDLIFTQHPGHIIKSEVKYDEDGHEWQVFDFLGSDISYCRQLRKLIINMPNYIKKIAKKYNVVLGKPCYSPNFHEASLVDSDSKQVKDYPIRGAVGALQWLATTVRPDVVVPVSVIAKYVAEIPTKAIINAVNKIIKYLLTTAEEGIVYSPQAEAQFNETYGRLLPEGREIPKMNAFSDAGFANCLKTMRSTSGSIIYWCGMPISWRSQRQSVRSYSTAESEYIGASDTIVLTETNDFMTFFEKLPEKVVEESYGMVPNSPDCILWLDNQAAISTAKLGDETRPKSRHYALRYLRVKDYCDKIAFTPTTLMKADCLTKLECSVAQRRLILHHVSDPVIENDDDVSESEDGDKDNDSSSAAAVLTHAAKERRSNAYIEYCYSIYLTEGYA